MIPVESLWDVLEIMFALNVVIGGNVAPVFKWLQNNANAHYSKAKEVNEKKYLVRRNLLVKQNVRRCENVEDTHAIENVALESVHLASNLAISSLPAKTTNVHQDATHQDVTHVIKQRKYLAIVVLLEFWFLVGWNARQNRQNVESNVRLPQIVTTYHESHIHAILALALHVVRLVTKY